MGFRQATLNDEGKLVGGYARVWSIGDRNGMVYANLNTSRKPKDSDKYEVDFQDGYVTFYGKAGDKIKGVLIPEKKGVPIQITSCDVRTHYDHDKKKNYVNYTVYDFEFADGSSVTAKSTSNKSNSGVSSDGFMNVPDGIDEELPFN